MPIIRIEYGQFEFSSGVSPTEIRGPDRDMNVVEHIIPGREGGIIEYLGSKSPRYTIKGILTAVNDTLNGPAGAVLSGTSYVGLGPDDAMQFLIGMRGSGVNLLRLESTMTLQSGYPMLYENDFFTMMKSTYGFEPGKAYPYYPYSIPLVRAGVRTFGDSSGLNVGAPTTSMYSGYAYAYTWHSGFYRGGTVLALSFFANSVSSGSARMALYNVSGPNDAAGVQSMIAQSASQPINSGWNYFPIRPLILPAALVSGNFFLIAIMTNNVPAVGSGVSILSQDLSSNSGTAMQHSGVIYNSGFPDPFVGITGNWQSGFTSGIHIASQIVTT